MMTLRQFVSKPKSIPSSTSWYLADLGEARGKQDLFAKQSPQKRKVLRESAMIESAVSSNRIEGITVDQARVRALVFGKPPLHDRNEEEVRGYRDALKLIHEQGDKLSISAETILNFHRMCRGEMSIWTLVKITVLTSSTYYYARDACSRSQRFPIEIMHGGSIYENQIGTFSEV